jgi:hypothetical protein
VWAKEVSDLFMNSLDMRGLDSHIGHEDSVGLTVSKVHIFATRWRI